ncbi:MAG: hypothetical protein CM1200mP10_30750 [Candidatus Neomarinimicrobiota bacterium]|nr:MAG: hypothetical protein CM1200mP10_30750 [Candidatus Neomarinimicrobiota bacterium]
MVLHLKCSGDFMDIAQFFTSADLYGIAPEIILTITALSVLTLEMFQVARSKNFINGCSTWPSFGHFCCY